MNANTSEQKELIITRILNAPIERVFEAWTDPKQIQKWWGPKDFKNPVCEWHAEKGGKIYIEMEGPDGVRYPMDGVFTEISDAKKIVFTARALDKGVPVLEDITTVLFEAQGNKTKLTVEAKVTKAVDSGENYLKGMNEGWNQSLDRLADLLK
jgi:uncharacterized protein YndB with AHSA1/START domain